MILKNNRDGKGLRLGLGFRLDKVLIIFHSLKRNPSHYSLKEEETTFLLCLDLERAVRYMEDSACSYIYIRALLLYVKHVKSFLRMC